MTEEEQAPHHRHHVCDGAYVSGHTLFSGFAYDLRVQNMLAHDEGDMWLCTAQ
jgi:hypothetical protein